MQDRIAAPIPTTLIELTEHRGTPVVAVTGEIDFEISARLESELARAVKKSLIPDDDTPAIQRPTHQHPVVIVDMLEVEFMDSVGLGALLGVYHDLKQEGGELRVVVADGPALTILKITDLDRVFGIYHSRDEAL